MASVEVPALSPDKYTVGWICAIPTELEAARNSLDVRHGPLQHQHPMDKNTYILGSIEEHNVAIPCLPEYSGVPAARAATTMQFTFPRLRFGLMVGVGGDIPKIGRDIRLGDVVVSLPSGQHGGVVQYDLGRMENKQFRRIGSLNKPPEELRTAVASLRSSSTLSEEISTEVDRIYKTNDGLRYQPMYPPMAEDILFKADAPHIHGNATCEECCKVPDSVISWRQPRGTKHPHIHYGNIASGNSVIKNAEMRDILSDRDDTICFEMEAFGLMDSFPCLVIRSVCDYADSYKNKVWQLYAAAVAAAYAKKLLSVVPSSDDPISESPSGAHGFRTSQATPHGNIRSRGEAFGSTNHFYGNVSGGKQFYNGYFNNVGTMNF